MTEQELLARTKQFSLRVMRLVTAMEKDVASRAIGAQLVRAGTSVGANYRAACRARSRAEFAAKIGVVEEEADESAFWLELIVEGGLMAENKVDKLHAEAVELTKIMAASQRSTRTHNRKSQIENRK